MHKTSRFGYFKDETVQVLRMDHKGRETFMAFILPVKRCGLDELLQTIDGNSLIKWIKNASTKAEVKVSIQSKYFNLRQGHTVGDRIGDRKGSFRIFWLI